MRRQRWKNRPPKLVRRLRLAGEVARRYATAEERSLPHFLVIGAQKSGTSGLYSYLVQHPQIVAARRKELHFFDGGRRGFPDTYHFGMRWYRAQFPKRTELPIHGITGEASPSYMFIPAVPGRIATHLPQIRMIALLRDPVERAISHYFHSVRMRREPCSLAEALRREEERLQRAHDLGEYQGRSFRKYSYKARGHYKEQLEGVYRHFAAEQILILDSAELLHDPANTLYKVFAFLGVDATFKPPNLAPQNVGTKRGDKRPEVAESVYDELEAYFRPYNQALYEYLGHDFGWRGSHQ